MKHLVLPFALLCAGAFAACSDDAVSTGAGGSTGGAGGTELPGTPLEADEQRAGDADAGYTALVNEGYVSCGLPWSVYSLAFGDAPEHLRLPGRTGKNEKLPYYYTAFTTKSDVEVVSLNCLVCHATSIQGQVVVGLGSSSEDFTTDPSVTAEAAGNFITDPDERAEWRKWADRVKAIAPYVQTTTVGVNPADNLAAALFAHRDPATLAWSEEPLLALPPEYVLPVDVPPWWHMGKKNAMFYSGGGRGDHARIMMTASTLCTDSVEEAQEIDAYFPDVNAYITSLQAPAFPGSVDQAKAEEGKVLFESTCSKCHGTYGASASEDSYPNLLIAVDDVGTDPELARGASQFAQAYVDWFNGSFYGEIASLEPQDGYVAPPLDGIWATAPYFHNGSVPTVEAVLNSAARPKYWTRTFDDTDLDLTRLGWNISVVEYGKAGAADANEAKRLYATDELGYGNGGHVYGDVFTPEQRAAVIEYLKTL
jgi:cytochrome c5